MSSLFMSTVAHDINNEKTDVIIAKGILNSLLQLAILKEVFAKHPIK